MWLNDVQQENKKPKVEAEELSIWEDRDEQENIGANDQYDSMVLEQTETEKVQMVTEFYFI